MNHVWKLLIALTLSLCSLLSQAAWTVRYQHTDVQGTAIAESNVQGSITQRFDYKPYGEGTPIQKTGIGYTGHLEDTDLGLTYMQQRYYDSVIGRFYSNDPVGFSASNPMMFNRYAYANNNPYKYTDPDGRAAESFFISGKVYETKIQAVTNAVGDLKKSLDTPVSQGTAELGKGALAAANAVGDRVSVTAQGTAGLGLGATGAAEVDSATFKGEGLKLAAGLTGTAYGATAGLTANFAIIQPDKSATGPIGSTTIMAGSGLGGGVTVQWTPSFGITAHAGGVAGVSVSSTVAGGETRVFEAKKD